AADAACAAARDQRPPSRCQKNPRTRFGGHGSGHPSTKDFPPPPPCDWGQYPEPVPSCVCARPSPVSPSHLRRPIPGLTAGDRKHHSHAGYGDGPWSKAKRKDGRFPVQQDRERFPARRPNENLHETEGGKSPALLPTSEKLTPARPFFKGQPVADWNENPV